MVKILTAVENTVAFPFKPGIQPGILGEHGLAVIVETDRKTFLYDTGRGKALLPNLETLGYSPDSFDGVILSHAHIDHFGGLMAFLKKRKERIPLYIHPDAFLKRYTHIGENLRYTGLPVTAAELESLGADIVLTDKTTALCDAITISGSVPRENDFELVPEKFCVEDGRGGLTHDIVPDDQALYIRTGKGIVVLSGCAHAGICNIVSYALSLFPGETIRAVIGGLHLEGESLARVDKTMQFLKETICETVAVGHCTGFSACCTANRELPGVFTTLAAGNSYTFD